jgi:hypothetical protein
MPALEVAGGGLSVPGRGPAAAAGRVRMLFGHLTAVPGKEAPGLAGAGSDRSYGFSAKRRTSLPSLS